MTGDIQVSLAVSDLWQAIGFYSRLLNTTPASTERRMAWFRVPGSRMEVELYEDEAAAPARVRLCVERDALRAAAVRIRETTTPHARLGLADAGAPDTAPRAVVVADPTGNRWELCTPLGPADPALAPPAARRAPTALARWLLASGPVERRLQRERLSPARRRARRAPRA